MNAVQQPDLTPEDRQRADLYNFLAVLLANPPDEILLAQVAGLEGDDTELGEATNALAKLAKRMKPSGVAREFNALFIGLGRGELLPYASYYLTGFLNEKPLALLRQDMMAQGLARSETVFEPEDNIASLMEIMGALIAGRFNEPATVTTQKDFFNKHVGPWARLFFADLEAAKGSLFYAPVGTLGRTFIDVEAEAFRLASDRSD